MFAYESGTGDDMVQTGMNTTGFSNEGILKGIPVSPGVGYGRPCFYYHNPEDEPDNRENAPKKTAASLQEAFDRMADQLDFLATGAENTVDNDTAALFRAHKMICEELRMEVLDLIRQDRLTATSAIEKCFDDYSEYFNGLNDDYLSERANDFTELKQLLLNLLNNTRACLTCREYEGCDLGECALKNEHILVCNELTASVAIRIRNYTKGIITDKCGVNSHAAVIARSLDIPVISGIKKPLELFSREDDILMDGMTGEIIINPDDAVIDQYRLQINQPHKSYDAVDPLPQFVVMADIDRCQDVRHAIRVKADGIGMYRTEFEMLSRGHFMDEEEQTEAYRYVIEEMQGKPVYFRLFDLGSDKSAPWVHIEKEDNPALGCRGARFLLARPEILESQARAIARVSQLTPVNVIYPMISSVAEFRQLKKIFMDATAALKNTHIRHGIMFEVPSACINAGRLYEEIEFGRIGSNDLIQYLFAQDRTSDRFNYVELANDPAVWNVITLVADAAHRSGKPLELCGSMTEIPAYIPELIKLGITMVSTRPENIAAVRKMARNCFDTGTQPFVEQA